MCTFIQKFCYWWSMTWLWEKMYIILKNIARGYGEFYYDKKVIIKNELEHRNNNVHKYSGVKHKGDICCEGTSDPV